MGRKICHRYRCSSTKCRTRVSLPRLVEQYAREPHCKACGAPLTLDRYRNETELQPGRVCSCDGYHFPHRIGGGVWCRHHPTGPEAGDYRLRFGPDCMKESEQ